MSVQKYDAVIVLGGGIDIRGALPEMVKLRVRKAVDISRNKIPIIFTGRWSLLLPYAPPITEAAAMASLAREYDANMKPELLLTEERAMDTIGNAYFTKTSFLAPRQWKRLLIITSEYHVQRSEYIFRKVLGAGYEVAWLATPSGLTAQELEAKQQSENRLLRFTQEFLEPTADGNDTAIWKVLQQFPGYSTHPKYNRQELLQLIDVTQTVDTYGLSEK